MFFCCVRIIIEPPKHIHRYTHKHTETETNTQTYKHTHTHTHTQMHKQKSEKLKHDINKFLKKYALPEEMEKKRISEINSNLNSQNYQG